LVFPISTAPVCCPGRRVRFCLRRFHKKPFSGCSSWLNFLKVKAVTLDSDSARFSQALRAAIFWPLGVVLAAAALLVVVIFQLMDEVAWSTHSYQVLAEMRLCENEMTSSQNSVRGYLLTGDSSFVTEYNASRNQAVADLNALMALVKDNPEQTRNAMDISQAKETWFNHEQIMISQRTPQVPANPDWVKMGSMILNDIHARFDRFAQNEIKLRDMRLRHVRRLKDILAYSGAALAALLALTIVYQVRRQMLELAKSYRDALAATEQRQAALARSESDLEAQKEWLRVTLTSIGDGVIVTDAAGRVVLMNTSRSGSPGGRRSRRCTSPWPASSRSSMRTRARRSKTRSRWS